MNVQAIAPATDKADEYTPIPMAPVTSNQVATVGYDAGTRTLALTFTRGPGTVYHYPDVDAQLHQDLLAADSIGKFFGQHIKNLPFKKYPAPAPKVAG